MKKIQITIFTLCLSLFVITGLESCSPKNQVKVRHKKPPKKGKIPCPLKPC